MLKVRVNGLTFSGYTTSGFLIGPDGFSGWTSGTDSKGQVVAREGAHGDFDLPVFRASRIVAISGQYLAESGEALAHAGAQVTGLGASGGLVRVVVDYNGSTTWADARVVSQTQFDERGGQRVADYQIQFKCADPRKFGESRTFASAVPAYHYGNFPAAPVFTITGARSGYTIPGPSGRSYVVTRAISGSEVHTVDMNDGLLRVNGAVVFGGVSQADTWAIPGGATVTHSLAGLVTRVTDTFV